MRIALLLLLAATATASADELKVGDRLAELDTATDAGGHAFRVKATKGWKMLTFGASWCKPCAKELPAWDGIAPDYKRLLMSPAATRTIVTRAFSGRAARGIVNRYMELLHPHQDELPPYPIMNAMTSAAL